ncbi:diguanylate cyclase [Pseudoalteromonas sp. SaAl2]
MAAPDAYKQYLKLEQQALINPNNFLKVSSAESPGPKTVTELTIFRRILVARLYYFHGDVTLSKTTFEQAYQIIPKNNDWLLGYWMLYRSSLSLEEGLLPESLTQIEQAIVLFIRAGDTQMQVRARATKAILLLWQQDYAKSLALLEDVYLTAKPAQMSITTMNYIYEGLAVYYGAMSLFDEAIKFAELAKDNAINNGDIVDGLQVISTLCSTYAQANKLQRAIACYDELIELSVMVKAPRFLFWAPAGKAAVSLKMKDYIEALRLLYLAKSYLDEVVINPAHVVAFYNNFAKTFLGLHQADEALEYLALSQGILENYDRPLNNRYKRQTFILKAKSEEQKNDFKAANTSLWQVIELVEQAKQTTQFKLEQEAQSKFESKQQEIKLQLAEEKLKNQQIELTQLAKDAELQNAYLLIGLLGFVSISIFAINQRRAYFKSQLSANTDTLTGIYNRRYILNYTLKHLIDKKKPFSLAILDIDHFKYVNDNYGHDIGDQALVGLAQIVTKFIQGTDCKFARYGGEEFLIVMPQFSLNSAHEFIFALCGAIREAQFTDKQISITSSAGVAEFKQSLTLNTILKHADTKLYLAKNTGRDKVCS